MVAFRRVPLYIGCAFTRTDAKRLEGAGGAFVFADRDMTVSCAAAARLQIKEAWECALPHSKHAFKEATCTT
jgi:hypothetical protein